MLTVHATGPQALLQDRGRIGYAHLGVPRAGALDRPAADLANRLVGNPAEAAVIEVLLGGLELGTDVGVWVAVTGAPVGLSVGGTMRAHGRPEWLPAGARLRLATPGEGLRSYVAVAGGVDVPRVLGSRSTDTLAWIGPPPLRPGDRLPVGVAGAPAPVDVPAPRRRAPVRVLPGPHADRFAPDALQTLTTAAWEVLPASDRVGLRLGGARLARTEEELPSEGTVIGAVQVPPSGQPVVLLADRGPTGGYPVLAVVHPEDLWQLAQVRPGERVTMVAARGSVTDRRR